MLDRPVRKLIDPVLEYPARILANHGISANAVTWFGFLLGITSCVAIGSRFYWAGLAFLVANRVCDGIDGTLARQSKPTDFGGFLDIVLDMLFYAGVPFAFAIADPTVRLPAMFLVVSFMGTSGSFLAFATISARRGITQDRTSKKSFFYSVGLMEGTETIAFFVLFCLFPTQFAILAWVFGGLCVVTTSLRIGMAMSQFREP
jgi:phosphatidylglycerophosphate synthase